MAQVEVDLEQCAYFSDLSTEPESESMADNLICFIKVNYILHAMEHATKI